MQCQNTCKEINGKTKTQRNKTSTSFNMYTFTCCQALSHVFTKNTSMIDHHHIFSQDGFSLVWGPICPTTYWKPSVCYQIDKDDDGDDNHDSFDHINDNNDGFDDNSNDDDRFRHPRPIDSWEGVKETKQLPNSCIQVRS